jgi:hypothetical protein
MCCSVGVLSTVYQRLHPAAHCRMCSIHIKCNAHCCQCCTFAGLPAIAFSWVHSILLSKHAALQLEQIGSPSLQPDSYQQIGSPSLQPDSYQQIGSPSLQPDSYQQIGSPSLQPDSYQQIGSPSLQPDSYQQIGSPSLQHSTSSLPAAADLLHGSGGCWLKQAKCRPISTRAHGIQSVMPACRYHEHVDCRYHKFHASHAPELWIASW